MQLPPSSTAELRIEFDTKQAMNSIEIPTGRHRSFAELEPRCITFLEMVQGTTQASIADKTIVFDPANAIDLTTGLPLPP
jgi:hypothetical protein